MRPEIVMIGTAIIYFVLFGILTLVGGVIGYTKKGSIPSIIAGTITGIGLLVSAWLLTSNLVAGLVIAFAVSLLLAGQFTPKFVKTGQAMPAGIMSLLSLVGLIVALVLWIKR